MKIAVTGSTGHIATSVIALLAEKKFSVRALQHKYNKGFGNLPVEIYTGDLSKPHSLQDFTDGCDVVIHCAARISINSNKDPEVYKTNMNGSINMFHAAVKSGVKRFIHVSSIHAYQQLPITGMLTEACDYCSNKSPAYDRSKRDAQKYVMENARGAMEVIVLNPTCVIGPPDPRPSLMGKAIIDMYNKKIPTLLNGGFDFCDVRDIAHGIVESIEKGKPGQAYLLSGKWYSLKALYKMIMEMKQEPGYVPVLPGWMAYAWLPVITWLAAIKKEEPLYTHESLGALLNGNKHINCEKAMRDLGYQCRPLKDTVRDTIRWYREKGLL